MVVDSTGAGAEGAGASAGPLLDVVVDGAGAVGAGDGAGGIAAAGGVGSADGEVAAPDAVPGVAMGVPVVVLVVISLGGVASSFPGEVVVLGVPAGSVAAGFEPDGSVPDGVVLAG